MSISGMPIGKRDELENLSVSGLVSLVRQLLERVETLEKENASLRAENAALREQLRAAKRPAAPFSKGPGPDTPKKPGRHRGKGRFERRDEPVPGPAGRVEELSAPLESPDCLRCGARLEVSERVATVEDTPPEPVRIIRRFRVEHGAYAVCGWSGRGRHTDLAPGQHGATAHRAGPHVMARALTLHYHFGLPLCKVPAVIRGATGIRRSRRCWARASPGCWEPTAEPVMRPGPWTPSGSKSVSSHLLKNLSAVEEGKTGRAKAFTAELKAALRKAVKLWLDHRAGKCAPEPYRERRRLIRQRVDRQLRDRRVRDPDNQRLLDGIGLQHDNGRVLLFLERPEMEATNNCAERGLRGAVIARKVSHSSKNERGARTYEIMKR